MSDNEIRKFGPKAADHPGVGPASPGSEYQAELRRLTNLVNAKVQEVKALLGRRIVSVVFGHHKDAPRPFALYRPGFGPIADGVEFPDSQVALRELRQGRAARITTYDQMDTLKEGHPDDFGPDGVQVVWLSDELESLASMEQQRDAARADAERMRPVMDAVRTWYGATPATSTADSAVVVAWEQHCEATGECYTCGRPRCPECKVCPLCAGDGHDEGCSRQGDEYEAEENA